MESNHLEQVISSTEGLGNHTLLTAFFVMGFAWWFTQGPYLWHLNWDPVNSMIIGKIEVTKDASSLQLVKHGSYSIDSQTAFQTRQ